MGPMALKKSELYSSLWRSCDELRGGMDASQYKDYVLTMLFIQYTHGYKQQMTSMATGVSVFGITKKQYRGVEVRLPSLEEQSAIADFISNLDAEIEYLHGYLAKIRLMKWGMMQELLTGRVRLVGKTQNA